MPSNTVGPYLSDPLLFESALLVALTLRPDVYYQELSDDIPAVEAAVKALNSHGWPVSWVPGSPGHITMHAFGSGTAEQARAYALSVMKAAGFIESVVAGPRDRLRAILDKAFAARCVEEATKRKLTAIYSAARGINAVGPIGSGAIN